MKLVCDSCSRIVNISQQKYQEILDAGNGSIDCKECGGSMLTDDEIKKDNSKEAEDEDTFDCEECDETLDIKELGIHFEESGHDFCKSCVKKAGIKPIIETKIVEKIVEKPVYIQSSETRILQENKSQAIFKPIF